ncbi:MAG: SRPBCC family protein, partial [Pseudomonadales bacterium]
PDEAASQSAAEQFKFLRYVVEHEDYATGIRQQVALASGARKMVTFGKNESGGARFHAWVDQLLETSDSELTSLFQAPVDPIAEILDRTNEGES